MKKPLSPSRRRRIQRVSEKKVDRFMKALWTFEKEVKATRQTRNDKSSSADSGNNEGI
jgi:hypothetical protein